MAAHVSQVSACGNPPPAPPKLRIDTVAFCTSGEVLLYFDDYKTHGSTTNDTCACGLVMPSGVTDVVDVVVLDSVGDTLPQFNFQKNSNTASGFNSSHAATWSGFASSISASVPAFKSITFCFRVKVTTCAFATIYTWYNTLDISIGTAGADANGVPNHHIKLYEAGAISSLPVELTHFSLQSYGSSNKLMWTTASEENNDHFVIEHSTNGVQFVPVARVDGYGNTSSERHYEYVHNSTSTHNYYRLKQVDHDGSYGYSKVISSHTEKDILDIALFPNPSSGQVTVSIPGNEDQITLQLIDSRGKIQLSRTLQAGESSFQVTEVLKPGLYAIRIETPQQVRQKPLVIQ